MKLICDICKRYFFYLPLPGKTARTPPNICGYRARTGKWIPSDFCYRKRNSKATKKYRDEKKAEEKFDPYATPQPDVIRYCIYYMKDKKRVCGEITGNNGCNYYFCDYHHEKVTNDCSDQYCDLIYSNAEGDLKDLSRLRGGKRINSPGALVYSIKKPLSQQEGRGGG